ncbi:MAG: hypothetical protein ISR65_06685 [Bacteriovoracaceae bacterium]|nr:hypothetical protein [Bacteriovoracaceae bacterium]
MKKLVTVCCLQLIFSIAQASYTFTIASFNIRLYGIGGEWSGSFSDEYRDRWVREYLDNFVLADVIAFQEIVDRARLKALIADKFDCASYEVSSNTHQYVMLCWNKFKFNFKMVPGESNFIIDESALNKYRPAVYGILTDLDGSKLTYITALHLKALPSGHQKRKRQMEIISARLMSLSDEIPHLVLGDFNTFAQTHDLAMIKKQLLPLGLIQVQNTNLLTYRTPVFSGSFDHLFISRNINVLSELKVNGPCNLQADGLFGLKRFDDLKFYNRFISDHCPILLQVQFL